MKHSLQLEAIGHDTASMIRLYDRMYATVPGIKLLTGGFGAMLPWVAEITGRDPKFKFKRSFLQPHVDYSRSNSIGSRGVFFCYALDEGRIYEVHCRTSWRRHERYFCRFIGDVLQRLAEDEVIACLS